MTEFKHNITMEDVRESLANTPSGVNTTGTGPNGVQSELDRRVEALRDDDDYYGRVVLATLNYGDKVPPPILNEFTNLATVIRSCEPTELMIDCQYNNTYRIIRRATYKELADEVVSREHRERVHATRVAWQATSEASS